MIAKYKDTRIIKELINDENRLDYGGRLRDRRSNGRCICKGGATGFVLTGRSEDKLLDVARSLPAGADYLVLPGRCCGSRGAWFWRAEKIADWGGRLACAMQQCRSECSQALVGAELDWPSWDKVIEVNITGCAECDRGLSAGDAGAKRWCC